MSTAALSWHNNCLNPRPFVACGGLGMVATGIQVVTPSTRRDGVWVRSRFCKVVSGDGNNMLPREKRRLGGAFMRVPNLLARAEPQRVKTVTKFRCQRSPEPGPMNICLWFHHSPSLCIHLFTIIPSYLCQRNASYLQLTRSAYMVFLPPYDCAPQHTSACFVYYSLGV
jgi:hypothetical protein